MPAFDYRQAQDIRDVLERHRCRYLFIGKSGAVLLGFPDTTQDADIFVEREIGNCRALVAGLRELGVALTAELESEIERGKDLKDRDSLPRLRAFREYLRTKHGS